VYSGSVGITSASALQVLLEDWDSLQQPWLREAQSWSLHARSLIFDTIQQALETSAQSTVALEEELAKCQSTWKLQRYDSMKGDDSSTYAILLDQWSFIYSMSRDIGRFRRVGEGKSLKLKEVNVIQWMRQWDLLGLPSAALKIYAASLVHRRLAPHWPMMEKIIKETLDTSLEIFKSRFWIPVKDLVDELMNRQSNPLLTGVSLQDEETSLDYMLRDLGFGDGTPATRHNAMVKASRQYEADMNDGLIRHAVGGRLVRLILIQVQQLKVGMLDAAKTIDVLFQANRFNIQLLAIIPATVIVWFGSNIIRRFLFTMRVKEIRPMKSVHSEMTEYLDAMESIVLLSNENETDEGLVHHQPQRRPVSSLMSEKQLGEFALAVYDYLLLLDYSSPQPFPKFQCDVIHETMTNFLGKGGSLGSLSPDSQLKFIKLVKGKHEELSKHL
jgi:nuclear-control-of-ATPase protein 2